MKNCAFFLFFCLAGCSSADKPVRPKSVIDKEKMIELMGAVFLLENYYQHTFGMPSIYKAPLKLSVDSVFNKYGVSAKEYALNYRYYAQQYTVFHEMNVVIIERYNQKLLELAK